MRKAKEDKLPFVLILEDDAVLVSDFKNKLEISMSELPDNWDALWLNGTERKKGVPYSDNLRTAKEIWGTFGYILNSSFYDTVIEGMSKELKSADKFYTSIQKEHNVFVCSLPLVKHRHGLSDIAGVVVDHYKHLE